jgi:hypothetical protein
MLLNQWRSLFIAALCVLPALPLSAEREGYHSREEGYHDVERRQMDEFYDSETGAADDAGNTGIQDYEGGDSPYYSDDPGQAEADSIFNSYDPDNR